MNNWKVIFGIGLLLRLVLPWYARGFRHMDEHWQVIEPANYLIHHVWAQSAEWVEGSRSWIYPGLVSLPLRFAEWLGIVLPSSLVAFVRSVHGLFSALIIPLLYFSILKLDLGVVRKKVALWTAWFVALWPFSIYCATHTHAEMVGAVLVFAAVIAPLFIKNRSALVSGFLFGVAAVLKIDVAIAGVAYGIWFLLNRRWRESFELILGVLPSVIILGLVDRITWGHWFNSVLMHGKANLVDSVGNQWGVSPWYTHVFYYYDIVGVFAVFATFLLLARFGKLWKQLPESVQASWFVNLFFVAVYCTIAHKEKRFLSPLVYTGIYSAFTTLYYAFEKSKNARLQIAWVISVVVVLVHGAINFNTYIIQQPWWDRISAIENAGLIPGIEKMFSPLWPATFYLSRKVPSAVIHADTNALEKAVHGVNAFGVAVDWRDTLPFERLGFSCEGWPTERPQPPKNDDPVPWAYKCVRR